MACSLQLSWEYRLALGLAGLKAVETLCFAELAEGGNVGMAPVQASSALGGVHFCKGKRCGHME